MDLHQKSTAKREPSQAPNEPDVSPARKIHVARAFFECGPLPKRNTQFLVPLGDEPARWIKPPARKYAVPRQPAQFATVRRWFLEPPDGRDHRSGNVIVRKRSGDCIRPYVRFDGVRIEKDRPSRKMQQNPHLTDEGNNLAEREARKNHVLHGYTACPCRVCEHCLRYRRRDWFVRTRKELMYAIDKFSGRTRVWFQTLTFAPATHRKSIDVARAKCLQRGVDFDVELTEVERMDARLREFYNPLLTRFIDRVRKSVGPMRYLAVAEPHLAERKHQGGDGSNFGQFHWHVLYAECSPERPLRKRALEAAFSFDEDAGIVRTRLVRADYVSDGKYRDDEEGYVPIDANTIGGIVNYVCAYVTSSAGSCRIRSSEKWGYPEVWDKAWIKERQAQREAAAMADRANLTRLVEDIKSAEPSVPEGSGELSATLVTTGPAVTGRSVGWPTIC